MYLRSDSAAGVRFLAAVGRVVRLSQTGSTPSSGSCAESICCLPGMSGDFQHLAERTKCLSRYLGGVIRAPVGDHHDPH